VNHEAPNQLLYRPAVVPERAAKAVSSSDYAGFALRCARRHLSICLTVGFTVATIGSAVVAALPQNFAATSKVYLQPSGALTSALTSGCHATESNEEPKPINTGVVFDPDNLQSLVREADLVKRWQLTRGWPLRWKDSALHALFGAPSVSDEERALTQRLASAIVVSHEDQGSLRFTVSWPEPEGAFLLTSLVQRNFFRDWQADEVAAISRASELLQEKIERTRDGVAPAIQGVQGALAKVRARHAAAGVTYASTVRQPLTAASPRALVERERDDPEVSSARIELEAVLSKSRELQARLDAARLELATNEANFGHRYKVVEPPAMPLEPLAPHRLLGFVVVLWVALALGALSAGAWQLARGRVLEAWQLRRLGVSVLAEVELTQPRWPRRR
jgi:hypothetical protein